MKTLFSGTVSCQTHFMSSQIYFLAFSSTSYFVNKNPFVTLELFFFRVSISGLSFVTNTNHPQSVFIINSAWTAVLSQPHFRLLISTMTLTDIRATSSSISNFRINHMPAYPLRLNHFVRITEMQFFVQDFLRHAALTDLNPWA